MRFIGDTVSRTNNRMFGWFLAAFFAFAGAISQMRASVAWQLGFYMASVLSALAAIFIPRALQSLNHAWYRFGLLLGRIVNPLVLGTLFFCLITPIAICMRLFGRDVLHVKRQRTATYWIIRSSTGMQPESFKNQY